MHVRDTQMPFSRVQAGAIGVSVCVCVCHWQETHRWGDPGDRNQSLDRERLDGGSASQPGHVGGDTDPQLPQVTAGKG